MASLLIIGLTYCSDNPAGNDNDPVAPGRLYVLDSRSSFLMSLDIPADTLVDSVRLDYSAYGVYTDYSGDHILINDMDNRQTRIYNAADLSPAGTAEYWGEYFFDNTDNYAVLISFADTTVYILDAPTLSATATIDIRAYRGFLDTLNNMFYASYFPPGDDTSGAVYVVDCASTTPVDTFTFDMKVYNLACHPE